MNDEPQLTAVGCRYRRRLTGDRGDQFHGCSERGKFVQERLIPKSCLSPD
jgi:hypothetical protein